MDQPKHTDETKEALREAGAALRRNVELEHQAPVLAERIRNMTNANHFVEMFAKVLGIT